MLWAAGLGRLLCWHRCSSAWSWVGSVVCLLRYLLKLSLFKQHLFFARVSAIVLHGKAGKLLSPCTKMIFIQRAKKYNAGNQILYVRKHTSTWVFIAEDLWPALNQATADSLSSVLPPPLPASPTPAPWFPGSATTDENDDGRTFACGSWLQYNWQLCKKQPPLPHRSLL